MVPNDINVSPPALSLGDAGLFRQQCYIDGQWSDAMSSQTVDVVNPATGRKLGSVPKMGATETARAIDAANRAWPAWREKTARDRAAIMRKWSDLQLKHADDLALICRQSFERLQHALGAFLAVACAGVIGDRLVLFGKL